ncbi:Nitrogen permease regulator 2 [Blastocladiella emersonii ATCC 22665]|nr:Nitrogen permease regulator 2 [Blastocladiella emersonii ATCC 22665]
MGRRNFHPQIYAVFLCEFHAVQGPRIALAVSSGSAGAPDLGPAGIPPTPPGLGLRSVVPGPHHTALHHSHSAPPSAAPHHTTYQSAGATVLSSGLGRKPSGGGAGPQHLAATPLSAPNTPSVPPTTLGSTQPLETLRERIAAEDAARRAQAGGIPLPRTDTEDERTLTESPETLGADEGVVADSEPLPEPAVSPPPPPPPAEQHRRAAPPPATPQRPGTAPAAEPAAAATDADPRPSLSSLFDTVSEFLIPKPTLCGSLVSIGIDRYRMLGHPMLFSGDKYPRNVALWNVVFVIDRRADGRGLHHAVTKVAHVLRTLELETEYVTNLAYRPAVFSVLQQMLLDLNATRECRVPAFGSTTLDIRLAPVLPAGTPEVNVWDVPVPRLDFADLATGDWDLTVRRILPLLDGVRPVSVVADLADVDPTLVRVAVQHLVRTGAVQLADLFQTTNVYVPTAKLRRLAQDPHAQEACVRFVARPAALANGTAPTPTRLFTLYTALKPGTTVAEYLQATGFPTGLADIRRFVLFGVIRGWIRRVHRYPLLPNAPPAGASQGNNPTSPTSTRGGGGGPGGAGGVPPSLGVPFARTTAGSVVGAPSSLHTRPTMGPTGYMASGPPPSAAARLAGPAAIGTPPPSVFVGAGSPAPPALAPLVTSAPASGALSVPGPTSAGGASGTGGGGGVPPNGPSPHSYGRSSYGGWGSVPGLGFWGPRAAAAAAAAAAGNGGPGMSGTMSAMAAAPLLPLDAYCVLWRMSAREVMEVLAKENVKWLQK